MCFALSHFGHVIDLLLAHDDAFVDGRRSRRKHIRRLAFLNSLFKQLYHCATTPESSSFPKSFQRAAIGRSFKVR